MRDRIKILYQDKFLFYTNTLTAFFFLAATVLVVINYNNLPPLIPIFNSMPWGMKRLYSSDVAILFPIILFSVIVINALLVVIIYRRHTLLSRLFSFNSFLVCVLGLLAILEILFLIY